LADLEVTASWAPHSNTPIPLATKFDAVSVATLDDHVLALARDGSVYAGGRSRLGQLGIGPLPIIKFKSHAPSAMRYVPFPVRVPDLTGVTAISAGRAHSLALLNDGTVRTWGSNTNGQVGDGTKINRDSPVPVPGVRNAVAIAAGTDSSFAVLTNGTVMSWGSQGGGAPDLLRPTLVAGAQGIRSIAAGVAHVAALTESGTVMTWGDNTYHQLARGNRPPSSPGVIKGLSGVQSIAAHAALTTAVLASGRIVAWGGGVREWTRPQAGMSIVSETPILLWIDGLDHP
jgi:alpha-tubulin suppressor-like RCC1 family protein